MGTLVPTSTNRCEFHIINEPENLEALDIALQLVTGDQVKGLEVDDEARRALQEDQQYVESLIASSQIRSRGKVDLSEEQAEQLDLLFMRWSA